MTRTTTAVAGIAAATLILCTGGLAIGAGGTATASCPPPTTSPPAPRPVTGWDASQVAHATTIITVGQQHGIPPRGWVIALGTAMQESSLRNLPHGDRDSLGLFQQRPSQGWGTPQQLLDPAYAAEAFYRKLTQVPDWPLLPLAQAAQAVQRSAFPDAYTRWETPARNLAAAITGTTPEQLTLCGAGGWVRPLHGPVTSGYGPRGDHFHNGVDIQAPRGTTIHVAADGVVLRVRCNATLHGGPPHLRPRRRHP
jgi:murein DD-endopeptidase MepM/ murein hydrolase activator NlpD